MKKLSIAIIAILLGLAFLPVFSTVNAQQVRNQVVEVEEETEDETDTTGTEVKTRVRVSEEDSNASDNATKTREEAIERIKEKAENAIANAVRRYERVKTQVQNCNLTDEEKTQIVEKIDTQITAMNTLTNQVQVAQTADEVKNVMTQLKTRFKFSLGVVRQAVKGVYEDRLTNVSEKINAVYEKIEARVTALPEGDEKDDLVSLLSEAKILIESADAKLAASDLVGAKEDYVDAHAVLHEIVELLNS
ncbi:MAG: hypothetical protein PHW75_02810 [Patescibacteria group bacterium]|nr:hypothetical protein [Patescibacteria group bacterium]